MPLYMTLVVAAWHNGSTLFLINVAASPRARLVLERVTVREFESHLHQFGI